MPRKGFTSISIPDELVAWIDKVIDQKKHGYESRAEVVKDAIRLLQRELKSLGK